MAAITICSDFGAPQNKVWHCFHCFPIYLPWSDGTRCHDLSFRTVKFKETFSLSFFTFIKRVFSSSSLSAIRVVSPAYLRLLKFLPASWFQLPQIVYFHPRHFCYPLPLFMVSGYRKEIPPTVSITLVSRNKNWQFWSPWEFTGNGAEASGVPV